MASVSWLLANASLRDRPARFDLLLRDGRVSLFPAGQGGAPPDAARRWDLAGRMVLPGLVEMHAHLDKTYSPMDNPEGTLEGAIRSFRRTAASRSLADVESGAARAIEAASANGVTRLRTHLNLGAREDLASIEVMQGLRHRFRRSMALQLVAMASFEQPRDSALLEEALRLGIDLIGGAPALARDPRASVDAALRAAAALDAPLDLHIDENERPDSRTLARLAQRKSSVGLDLPVTASHCCSLAFQPRDEAKRTMDDVAAARISVVALPACNLTLMGRGHWPAPRGMTPVAALLEAGVNVTAGSDNVRDPFNPFGGYDPLQTAQLCAMVGQLTTPAQLRDALDLVTTRATLAFDGGTAQVKEGAPADLVVLDATEPLAAVVNPPPRLATFKAGQLVVRSHLRREWWPDSPPTS